MATPLRAYVEETFSASDADACGEDFGEAQRLRDGAISATTSGGGGGVDGGIGGTAVAVEATRAKEALTS